MIVTVQQTDRSVEQKRKTKQTLTHKGNQNKIQAASEIGKNELFNNSCWDNWNQSKKKKKVHPYFILYTRVNSKWIKDLNFERREGQTIKELKKTRQTPL